MKFYLPIALSFLSFTTITNATTLNDFYAYKNEFMGSKFCKSTNHSDCKSINEQRVKLLSEKQGLYKELVANPNVYQKVKTCHVELVHDSKKYKSGEKGFVRCAARINSKTFTYDSFSQQVIYNYDGELRNIFNQAKENRDLHLLNRLADEFSHNSISTLAKQSITEIKNVMVQQKKKILAEFGQAKSLQQKIAILEKISRPKNGAQAEVSYRDTINQNKIDKMISDIYKMVQAKNNIAGYNWYIENYPSSLEAKKALKQLHQLAFEISEDIDTINSYNDFTIAYPLAKQVKQATERAFDMEMDEYTGFFSDEEKEARRLLIQSKMLEQDSEDYSSSERTGYMIVVNRMNDLLKQEFNSTDAALRHLESNEFKSFVRSFKRAMKDLKHQVSRIAENTKDLSSIMRDQSNMMNNHFENAAQDREMATELTKQHRFWERYIGEVGS